MINLDLSWQESAGTAVVLGAVSAGLLWRGKAAPVARASRVGEAAAREAAAREAAAREAAAREAAIAGEPVIVSEPVTVSQRTPAGLARTGSRMAGVGRFVREAALFFALFALWQYAGSFSALGPVGATGRARWIWRAERALHLPNEAAVQRLFLPHPLMVQGFNFYYDILHFPVLLACLIWLFVRHRDHYGAFRTSLVAFTGASLLIQLIPVAPPRLVPATGMVDTALRYGESVYSAVGGFDADQLSAMPSVHVGWAILIAVGVIAAARTPWRWLAVAYPLLTTLDVVVTANHFWADGIVAGVLLAAVLSVQSAIRHAMAAHKVRRLLA